MGIELKIIQGTGRLTGISLCRTCRNAHVYEDRSGEHVRCNNSRSFEVRGDVKTCSEYDDKTLPWLHDLKAIAWTFSTDKKTNKVGFMPPRRVGEDD